MKRTQHAENALARRMDAERRKRRAAQQERDTAIKGIASTHLRIETLATQHSDELDFHDLAVWSLKAALEAAYEAGRAAAAKDCPAQP